MAAERVLEDMRRLADAKGVQPHEYPLRVVFIDELFTQQNGMRNAAQPTVSRPFLARFPPFFRRSCALSGFLAPRRRERAKNGGKWAKFGGETGEKQRWLSGVGGRTAAAAPTTRT